MSYESVDRLQNVLAEEVFHYAQDRKKAAGRALGTIVELIAFYTLSTWGFRDNILIERPLPEFANPGISHNVEYSLHPKSKARQVRVGDITLPLTGKKIFRSISELSEIAPAAASCLLTKDSLVRNCCIFDETPSAIRIVHLEKFHAEHCDLSLVELATKPFAIVECKRVGIEEGMRKGPQTIEKAKQGAYVARSVSALQKVRLRDGSIVGVIPGVDGQLLVRPHRQLLDEVISSNDGNLLRDFILTIGMVSNHGNWFTSDNPNKELRVLAQSYDWLLFLSDRAIARFVQDVLLDPEPPLKVARVAFLASYSGAVKKTKNRFTKVGIDLAAHLALTDYFQKERNSLDGWYNIISPKNGSLDTLRKELSQLNAKNWLEILGT